MEDIDLAVILLVILLLAFIFFGLGRMVLKWLGLEGNGSGIYMAWNSGHFNFHRLACCQQTYLAQGGVR